MDGVTDRDRRHAMNPMMSLLCRLACLLHALHLRDYHTIWAPCALFIARNEHNSEEVAGRRRARGLSPDNQRP